MERQSMKKTKKKLLISYLPLSASPVTFRSPTLSPMRRPNSAAARFYRRTRPDEGSTHEPSSPEVSCIGTVKLRKDRNKKKKKEKASEKIIELIIEFTNFKLFGSKAVGSGNVKSDDRGGCDEGAGEIGAPSLGQIKRFASGRRWSADFDWAAQVTPVNDSGEKEEGEEMIELSSERKREIDLWRRRNLNLRLPLQTASQSK